MVFKLLQSLLPHSSQLTKLICAHRRNLATLSPAECGIRSTIKLCDTIDDLKPLNSLLIVTGFIDYKLVISEFVDQCFDLGSPELALSAFCISKNRSLLLQNVLIKRLCNLGLYQDAIFVFRKCSIAGCSGGDYTFPHVIKACSALQEVELGKEIHCFVLRTGYVRNVVVQTALIDFYSKIGRVDVARLVFDEMSERDVVSWNTLILGYSLNGLDHKAVDVFRDMLWAKGMKPNVGTLASILPICTRLRFLNLGKSLHGYAVKSGWYHNELLTPALISMYANDGDIFAAQHLYDISLCKNLVIWNSMIYAHTLNQNPQEAIELFSELVHAELQPNMVTFVSVIPCCAQMNSIYHGKCLHGHAIKYGLHNQVSVSTALISMYAKLGDIDSAIHIFSRVPQKNHLTWNAIISGYLQHGFLLTSVDITREMQQAGFELDSVSIINVLSACSELELTLQGKSVHAISIRKDFDSNINLSNLLLAFYSNCNQLQSSFKLFDRMAQKNTVSWNTMISGCAYNAEMEKAKTLLWKMQEEGLQLDVVTLISILPVYNDASNLLEGMAFHAIASKLGWTCDVTLTNTLISMYCNCGDLDSAKLLFYRLKERSLVSWNSLITGYKCHNLEKDVLLLLKQLIDEDHIPNYITLLNVLAACRTLLQGKSIHAYALRTGAVLQTPLLTSLISMYSRFKNVALSLSVFEAYGKWDIPVWNSMMSAFIKAREAERAISLFDQLLQIGLEVDHVTILSLVSACILINSIPLSNSTLAYVMKTGFFSDTTICNSLIDLFAKSGDILMAREVFETSAKKDTVSWSLMINGYGLHGDGNSAISLLEQIEKSTIQPDTITYLSVLSACSHSGLAEQSKTILNSMVGRGIEPGREHLACVLDLLGRRGHLYEAYEMAKRLPQGASVSMLESLLGASRVHGNVELGKRIGELLIEKEPENPRIYVMLHNIYADAGRWQDAKKIRNEMEERELRKLPGFSVHA